jgi:hypothetical protein
VTTELNEIIQYLLSKKWKLPVSARQHDIRLGTFGKLDAWAPNDVIPAPNSTQLSVSPLDCPVAVYNC